MPLEMVVENDDVILQRRRAGGKWLQGLRKQSGLTQQKLAALLNLPYYTFIAQIENGHAKLPEKLYRDYSKALSISDDDYDWFFANCLKYYHDPSMFERLRFMAILQDTNKAAANDGG
jgi:transcriptional regulator with XRE-family HTH domain